MPQHDLSEQAAIAQDPAFVDVVKMSLSNKITEVLQDPASSEQDMQTATNASSLLRRIVPEVSQWCAGADLSTSSTDAEIDVEVDTLFSTSIAYRVGSLRP
jgi:hypothetical protein